MLVYFGICLTWKMATGRQVTDQKSVLAPLYSDILRALSKTWTSFIACLFGVHLIICYHDSPLNEYIAHCMQILIHKISIEVVSLCPLAVRL